MIGTQDRTCRPLSEAVFGDSKELCGRSTMALSA
ncbi:hypothetical protein D4764_12G0003980 [Takifugu flavidus]|uniref:Uncharacterized protein n=1 Tax=Takifugu flavidus TaxID=433684 RepID=A0A5C6PEE4_9TELE|nr:hypothetical protein D4764_12G0003980 [Takifugu flavidus]